MDELNVEQLKKLMTEGESRYTEFKEPVDLEDQKDRRVLNIVLTSHGRIVLE